MILLSPFLKAFLAVPRVGEDRVPETRLSHHLYFKKLSQRLKRNNLNKEGKLVRKPNISKFSFWDFQYGSTQQGGSINHTRRDLGSNGIKQTI